MSFFLYIIYKALFFAKILPVISGPIFIKFSPLKFKFNIVSYRNFEISLQFLNNSKLNYYDVKKYEILEQQIATSKLEGIHKCADRTEQFVNN